MASALQELQLLNCAVAPRCAPAPARANQAPCSVSHRQSRRLRCRAAQEPAAASDASAPPLAPPPAAGGGGSRIGRLLSWRTAGGKAEDADSTAGSAFSSSASSGDGRLDAQQLEVQQQLLLRQRQRQAPAQQRQPGGLYSWLTWGGGANGSSSNSDSGNASIDRYVEDAADVGDGMAAGPPMQQQGQQPGSVRRRSWYRLGGGGSGDNLSTSSLDEEAGGGGSSSSASGGTGGGAGGEISVRVDHAALQLLRTRCLAGSRPGQRRDPFKLGLVVEGGGMRGCVSGGALQALADLGLRDCFDALYGSSAGAINGTYFLSGGWVGVGWGGVVWVGGGCRGGGDGGCEGWEAQGGPCGRERRCQLGRHFAMFYVPLSSPPAPPELPSSLPSPPTHTHPPTHHLLRPAAGQASATASTSTMITSPRPTSSP